MRITLRALAGQVAAAALLPAIVAIGQDFAVERRAMVAEIRQNVTQMSPQTGIAALDPRVLAAFEKVPRHLFVPPPLVGYAYADTPLPLGHGQNLTQPFIAALMTHLLGPKPGESVFETGTDTGYQAAVLAELGARVFSVEIVEPLYEVAKRIIGRDGNARIALRLGDGYYGWAEHAPYDAMLIKESAADVPPPLWQQLKPGGRMVIPLGPPAGPQVLTLIRKDASGRRQDTPILPVRFTPFQGGDRI